MTWNDMTKMEKVLFVISCIAAVLVVASMVKPGLLPEDITYPAIAVFTVCEAIAYWNKNRKLAYLMIAAAVISMASFVLGLCLAA